METTIQTLLFQGQPSFYLLAVVFAAGLLTSLTPCVYPMLPITVSVVGSQARTRSQSVAFSLLYVLGLALVYSLLGYLAASSGQLFGTVATHPLTLLLVAGLCLLMALWMSGWVAMPNLMTSTAISVRSAWLNVLLAGAVSGLVMAPCTSPVLGMMLMYVTADGNPAWGASLMFVFAFGMSALLIAAGSFTGLLTTIPRSGRWMLVVKWLMALPMFAASFYFFWQIFTLLR